MTAHPAWLRALSERLGGLGRMRRWVVLGALVGFIAGLAAAAFFIAIDLATAFFMGTLVGYDMPSPAGEAGVPTTPAGPERPWLLPAVVGAGALISALIVYRFAREAEGAGQDAAIGALHHRPRGIRARVPVVKTVASALLIGSGGSAGREGPMAQIGAGVGSAFARLFDLDARDARVLPDELDGVDRYQSIGCTDAPVLCGYARSPIPNSAGEPQTLGVTTERPCPACGAPVGADAAFCGQCDSLLSPAAEPRPDAGATVPAQPKTPAGPAAEPDQPVVPSAPVAPRVPVVPSRTIDCWSCDTPNTPSRMFCVHCGSFIAIGSQARTPPEAEPFSGPPPVPGDADVDASLPLIAGVAPLGCYSVEEQRRATRRTRVMTAVTSVALAMVIGAAALYLASPLSDREAVPEMAAVAPTTTEPAAVEPAATDETGAVSGITVQPEVAPAVEVVAEPEPIADPEPVVEPEPIADPEPVVEPEPIAVPDPEPVADPEPLIEPEPEAAGEPESVIAAEPVVEAVAAAEPEPELTVADPAEPVEPPGYGGGWVCNDEITIEDSRLRDWAISNVSFRPRTGFERVVIELARDRGGSGDPSSITADAMGSWKVEENLSGTARPGLGRRSVVLQLDDGFTSSPDLRRYRPSGLDIVKEFSIYPARRDGRNVVISADTGGCYRVRVPGWDDPSASVRRAEIHVDIRP